MAASFRQLFRQSRFTSTDPSQPGAIISAISQKPSMKSSMAGKIAGEFGLKRPFPTVSSSQHIVVEDIDTRFGFSRVHDAGANAIRSKVYEENFGLLRKDDTPGSEDSKTGSPAYISEKPNLYTMPNEEFSELLKKAKSMREVYSKEVERYPTRKGSLMYSSELLGVTSTEDPAGAYPCSFGYLSAKAEKLRDHKVRGRILNRTAGGYAVGIGGAVGFLPYVSSEDFAEFSLNPEDRSKTYDFYLQDLRWSRDLRPHVVVSLKKMSVDEQESEGVKKAADGADGQKSEAVQQNSVQTELQSLLDEILSATKGEDSSPRPLNAKKPIIRRRYPSENERSTAVTENSTAKSDTQVQESLSNFLTAFKTK